MRQSIRRILLKGGLGGHFSGTPLLGGGKRFGGMGGEKALQSLGGGGGGKKKIRRLNAGSLSNQPVERP